MPSPKIPICKIEPFSIWHYEQYAEPYRRSLSDKEKENLKGREQVYSLFSFGARKRLANTLENYITTLTLARDLIGLKNIRSPRSLGFFTATLSAGQQHCDKVIKREVLNKFLIKISRSHDLRNYIWKAEPQKNGNIHFHILIDKFIHWKHLRHEWNRAQESLGYISEFERKHRHRDPNSTDIHALMKVKNASRYMMKYMSKDERTRPICGHTWGRSDSIGKMRALTLHLDLELVEWFQRERDKGFKTEWSNDFCYIARSHNEINYKTLPAYHKERVIEQVLSNIDYI